MWNFFFCIPHSADEPVVDRPFYGKFTRAIGTARTPCIARLRSDPRIIPRSYHRGGSEYQRINYEFVPSVRTFHNPSPCRLRFSLDFGLCPAEFKRYCTSLNIGVRVMRVKRIRVTKFLADKNSGAKLWTFLHNYVDA